ncbi:MAG: HAD family phosphatase [Sphingobacteriales bacterium]|nr:MAG: HAD family phosphatase [Sphingobacteriales bacterium]
MTEISAAHSDPSLLANKTAWAVIFDMDGTLVATTEADFLAWQKLFIQYGKQLTFEDYYPLLGRKSADVVKLGLGLTGKPAEEAMAMKMGLFADIVAEHGVETLPDVRSLLEKLYDAGIPMALATSSRKKKMELVMQTVGLEKFFSVFVTGEEVVKGKPDPQIFQLAASRLQMPAERCIVVEDTVSGVRAAKAAGMTCVAISTTHDRDELTEADLLIDHFTSLRPEDFHNLIP